jgi:sigma-B regulation protein RsbU (phosphoserine phosphatase)
VEILSDATYLTACYVNLNRKKKSLTIVNAGHPPVIYLPKEGEARLIDLDGDILGIFKDVYYGQQDIKVSPGDRFLLYSDGLIERPALKKVWTKCLPEILKACSNIKNIPTQALAEEMARMMIDNTCKPDDDIVVLGVEV